jgi:hypothetical protein
MMRLQKLMTMRLYSGKRGPAEGKEKLYYRTGKGTQRRGERHCASFYKSAAGTGPEI